MNIVKVSIVIQSILSDELIALQNNKLVIEDNLKFIKYLIHHFPDTNQEIDLDQQVENFINS
jgi:hypothetical protein